MQDATVVAAVRRKYVDLVLELDERSRRRWAAVEARSLGRGGIATVATATGLSDRTIRTGLKELADPVAIPLDRQCRAGGGRKSHRVEQPGLAEALNRLIEPTARGTPMSPLRWTIKSRYRLADELRKQGFAVGPSGRRRFGVCCGNSTTACRAIARRKKAVRTRIGTANFATSARA